jgi:flavodoxin I
MKIAIVFTSQTGHTEELVLLLSEIILMNEVDVELFRVEQFPILDIDKYAGIVIGTYTWGNGEIPLEMKELYHAFERQNVKHVITGVAGTGDSGYSRFCGAVDEFRNMLYVHTKLAVSLKIEVSTQMKDLDRCIRFVDILLEHLHLKKNEKFFNLKSIG